MAWLSTCLNRSPNGSNVLPAIFGHVHQRVHRIDSVKHVRAGAPAPDSTGHFDCRSRSASLPRLAPVGGSIEAALAVDRFDQRVHHVRLDRRDGHRDAAQVHTRQAACDLAPGLAAVGRLVNRRFRAAIDQRPDVSAPLVGDRVQGVRIARVVQHIRDARVLADVQDQLPGLAAVGGLVETAIAARSPQGTLSCYVDHVWNHADRSGSCRCARNAPAPRA